MYKNFEKINGQHPWRSVGPDGYVDYPARYRSGGKIIYFNFHLAKDLGLIPKSHAHQLTPKLEQAILHSFSIQILNEHDWIHRKSFPQDHLTNRLYMATRYLQSQHENKQGKTSGDGRSIWNGYIKTRARTYDISSCGTGSTILSPGVQEAMEPVPTGSEKYGYSSGLADLDEMLSGAIMSEIFYRQGFPSERCLTVIEYKDKTAIGVRTAPNLIRPAHFFRYLKQNQWSELKKSFDYFVQREIDNGVWNFTAKGSTKYFMALKHLSGIYAKLAAVMEEEYIFNWLYWDGDNILASGAILDYGSIRQFAAKHDKYRYEDVDRFSTSLNEQRYWARKIIQTFIQAVDFIVTKEKKNLETFNDHHLLELFDQHFQNQRYRRMLYRVGFTDAQTEILMREHKPKVENFRGLLRYFEQIKTVQGEEKVPDGIDHPPIFLIRHLLRDLPNFIYRNKKGKDWPYIPPENFCNLMAAMYVNKKDLALNDYRRQKAREFQDSYKELIYAVGNNVKNTLKVISQRSSVINYEYRSTGDGLTWIVNEAIKARNRMSRNRLIDTIERFIESQVLVPGKWKPIHKDELKGKTMKSRLLRNMQKNLENYSERI